MLTETIERMGIEVEIGVDQPNPGKGVEFYLESFTVTQPFAFALWASACIDFEDSEDDARRQIETEVMEYIQENASQLHERWKEGS